VNPSRPPPHPPEVQCARLASWSAELRSEMDRFPGRDWRAVAEQEDISTSRTWWKLVALDA
jgi:hypothetical protein